MDIYTWPVLFITVRTQTGQAYYFAESLLAQVGLPGGVLAVV
jgi:hypothetical protein